MTNSEAVIKELRDLVKSPSYAGTTKQKPGKIDKKSLLNKAQKVAENLDKNDSLSSPTPA